MQFNKLRSITTLIIAAILLFISVRVQRANTEIKAHPPQSTQARKGTKSSKSKCEGAKKLVEAKVSGLRSRVSRDKAAIQVINKNFLNAVEEIQEWQKLSEEAQVEAINKALDVIKDIAFDELFSGIEKGLDKTVGRVYPINAREEIEKRGIKSQWIKDRVSELAQINKNDPLWEKKVKRLLDAIKSFFEFKNAVDKSKQARKVQWDEFANVAFDVLPLLLKETYLNKNPAIRQAGLLFAEGNAAIAAVYDNLTRRFSIAKIEAMTNLTEKDFGILKSLTEKLADGVQQLKRLEQDLASLSDCNDAEQQEEARRRLSIAGKNNKLKRKDREDEKEIAIKSPPPHVPPPPLHEQALQELRRQLSNNPDPIASSTELRRQLHKIGIKVASPGDGSVKVTAESASGYAATRVRIINQMGDIVAINANEFYLIPANSGSTSQRIGLVSVIERQAMNLDRRDVERFEPENTMGDSGTGGPLSDGDEHLWTELGSNLNLLLPQIADEQKAWAYKNWIILAPRADVVVSFNSVCLDQGRATPKNGEGFYLSDRPLPERIQQILGRAAMNGAVPQSEVWGAIAAERIRWYDPRTIPEMLQKARLDLSSSQFASAIATCNEILSMEPSATEAVKLLGESYYWLGLHTKQTNQAGQLFAEGYSHLAKAISLGHEVVLPVAHHHGGFMDQNLCQGFVTLTRDRLGFRSNDSREGGFEAPYGSMKEVKLELQKTSRFHVRVGLHDGRRETVWNYNFHSALVGTNRQVVPLSLNDSIVYNELVCTGECQPSVKLIYDLVQKFRYYKGNVGDSLPSLSKVSLRFVETGEGERPVEQRKYETRFSASTARFINWQLELGYNTLGRRIQFVIKAIWYGHDGKVFWEDSLNTYSDATWSGSLHSDGVRIGNGKPWKPGKYRVDLYVGEKQIASGLFEIYKPK